MCISFLKRKEFNMADFQSEQGQIPEIDPSKFESIAALVNTFEQNDLITRNVIDFKYDSNTEYVFINLWSLLNGKSEIDVLLGFNKNKVITLCQNVLAYFENQRVEIMNQAIVNKSKFLSLVLRHKPEQIGLVLDSNGWANVDEILQKMEMDFETLQMIVDTNDKKRFTFNEDKSKIRANQGHSLQSVDLQLEKQMPPEYLFHGTAIRFLDSIKVEGLTKQSRQHVHLSMNVETALKVGQRHGKPVVLKIFSKKMFDDGYEFYLSDNNVWLTDHVPTKYFVIEI